jgi:hypothetical protein
MRGRPLVLLASVVALTSFALPAQAAAGPNAGAFGPNAEPYGHSYEEWFIKWTKWALEPPADENALLLKRHCELNQSGPVWFLPVGIQRREVYHCTVPAGMPIGFPVDWLLCNERFGGGDTAVALRDCAREFLDKETDTFRLWVDSRPFVGLRGYDVLTRAFDVTLPEDGVLGTGIGGRDRVVQHGPFVIFRPLDPGGHRMRVHSKWVDPDGSVFIFDRRYFLTVEE